MIVKIIGVGAAGNKAAICAVENTVVKSEDVMLINSTLKDIPADYKNKNNCYEFIGSRGGCGKERTLSYKLCTLSLENDIFKMDDFLSINKEDQAELVIVVASTEGGTGSGSAVLISKYIKNVYGIAVHIYALAGFDDDPHGMSNTVDFFKELDDSFTVQCTKNSNFLEQCNKNKLKAEKEANAEFCKKVSILIGLHLRDSDHNIDPTDLLKLSTKPLYMVIEYVPIDQKIKNREQFRNIIISAIDNSKAMSPGAKDQKWLGVMINIKEEYTDYIDYFDTLVEYFGVPYEKFEHIQHEPDMPQFIAFISAGLTLPTDEIEDVYNNYQNTMKKVRVDKSSEFFDAMKSKQIEELDPMFDLYGSKKETISKKDFFASAKGTRFSNTKSEMKLVPKPTIDEF